MCNSAVTGLISILPEDMDLKWDCPIHTLPSPEFLTPHLVKDCVVFLIILSVVLMLLYLCVCPLSVSVSVSLSVCVCVWVWVSRSDVAGDPSEVTVSGGDSFLRIKVPAGMLPVALPPGVALTEGSCREVSNPGEEELHLRLRLQVNRHTGIVCPWRRLCHAACMGQGESLILVKAYVLYGLGPGLLGMERTRLHHKGGDRDSLSLKREESIFWYPVAWTKTFLSVVFYNYLMYVIVSL